MVVRAQPTDRVAGLVLRMFGGPPPTPGGRDAAGRVLWTTSRLLFEVLAWVYVQLGLDVLGDDTFRDLVIARSSSRAVGDAAPLAWLSRSGAPETRTRLGGLVAREWVTGTRPG